VREDTLIAQPFDASDLRTTGDAVPFAEDVRVNSGNGRAAFDASESGMLVYRTGGAGTAHVQLTWFDRSGRVVGLVGEPKDYRGLDLSADGQKIVVHLHEDKGPPNPFLGGSGGLWLLDPLRGTQSRFTFGDTHDTSPYWSPDGSRVVFSSVR